MKNPIPKNKRIRGERIVCEYGIRDCYKFYKKTVKYKQFTTKYTTPAKSLIVEIDLYLQICKDALRMIKDDMIYKAKSISLPYLNDIYIFKKKLSILGLRQRTPSNVDWVKTMQIGKKVLNFNEDRDYHVYRIKWNKYGVRIPHRSLYTFIPSRGFKREIAKALKGSKSIDYPERLRNTYPRFKIDINNDSQ